jgi:hypothetical protein
MRTEELHHNERVKAEMAKDIYARIPHELQEFISIKNVDVPDYDYSSDTQWQELKKASDKAYKALKVREFEIRNA